MKKLLLIGIFLYQIPFFTLAQHLNWNWAKPAGNTSLEWANDGAVDANSNFIAVGIFYSPTIVFGATTLTNLGDCNIFITKYDSLGNVIWSRSAGGTGYDFAKAVAVDAQGNIYVTGYFRSPNFIVGTDTLDLNGQYEDIYLIKYSPTGNVVWTKAVGGTDEDEAFDVATDLNGNIFITGYFQSTSVTFGSYTLNNSGTNLTSNLFVVKYNNSGVVQWAKTPGGNTGAESGYGLATDGSGNVTVTGGYGGSPIFGSYTLPSGSLNGYVAKYNSSGTVLWAKAMTRTFNLIDSRLVVNDLAGNSYVAGEFSSPYISFGTDSLQNGSNSGYNDAFIAKYDPSGNYLWSRRISGPTFEYARGLTTDGAGTIYLTGAFQSAILNLDSVTSNNPGNDFVIMIIRYDAAGNVTDLLCNAGSNDNELFGCDIDAAGKLYVTGRFKSNPLTLGNDSLNCMGDFDVLVGRLTNSPTSVNEYSLDQPQLYPNPAAESFTLSMQNPVYSSFDISVTDLSGREWLQQAGISANTKFVFGEKLPAGFYIARITSGNKIFSIKLVKND